ncbi:hypothetical protein D6D13_07007 [Aureobasidium pullulans]|uniref:Uncharacterized protein n=1 Tax=Aureobasidium pullulans TaxID=5580 RepID=A0A4S9CIC6_AURPU|nr:hypothetical protein D6D13_07007 [Aureobasidium pullulans]
MSCTTIDFANYVSDGDSRLWPILGPDQGQRQAQPLAPLLVVLIDYILAHHALEFLPFNGSLRVLNLPPGYIATVYTNANRRVVHTCHGHPRGAWPGYPGSQAPPPLLADPLGIESEVDLDRRQYRDIGEGLR